MKRCPNPDCRSEFFFGDTKTRCPFCHSVLVQDTAPAASPRVSLPLSPLVSPPQAQAEPVFMQHGRGGITCTGRVLELDHQAVFYSRAHKLFNALVDDGIAPEIRRSYSYTNIEAAQPVPVKEDIAVTMEAEELSSVAGLRIALTGNFECCSRAEVETALAQMGAKLTNSISSKTNYLIVGGLGSDRWKYNNGGGKIQQAAQLGVKILPETAISGLLKEAQNV